MAPHRTPQRARGMERTHPDRFWIGGWNGGKPMPVDPHMAARFLRWLEPHDDNHAFRLIHDRDRTQPTRLLFGTLEQHADQLATANANGYGVFYVVNATDGTGQATQNVTRVRAGFTDLDGAPLPPPLEHMAHAIVWTSPPRNGQEARAHLYWRTDPTSVVPALFRPIQQGLAQRFGGDRSVVDLPRVLRLPGYLHGKAEPFRVTAWSLDSAVAPMTVAELRGMFSPVADHLDELERQRAAAAERQRTPAAPPPNADALDRAIRAWFSREAAAIGGEGRHALLNRAARHLLDNGVPQGAAESTLLNLRDLLPPRADGTLPPDHEVRQVITWTWGNLTPGDPWDLTPRDDGALVIRDGTPHRNPLDETRADPLNGPIHANGQRTGFSRVLDGKTPVSLNQPLQTPMHGFLSSSTTKTQTRASMQGGARENQAGGAK